MKSRGACARAALALGLILAVSACGGEHPEVPKNGGTALLVMDCQSDYLQADGRMPAAQNQVAPMIMAVNELIGAAGKEAIPVIYTKNEFRPWDYLGNFERNYAAARYTPGQALDPRINDVAGVYFNKDYPDALSNGQMRQHLAIIGSSTLVMSGVLTGQTVLDTAKAAMAQGFKVIVISDAVVAKNAADREKVLSELKSAGAEIKTSSEYIGGLRATA